MKHGLMTIRAKPLPPEKGEGMETAHGAHHEHSGHSGSMDGMESGPTLPQLAAVTMFTLLMLAFGMALPSAFVNMRLSAHDVRGAIMPPGMTTHRDTSAAAMRDMAAVDPRDVTAVYGLEKQGAQLLASHMDGDIKVFDLEASVIRWQILPDVLVDAFAFNGQVPGPTLRFRQGDRVRINVTNRLPETTTVHWHGLILPNVMDGPANVTQEPIRNGGTYRYEFTALQSGSYLYHSHDHVDRQQALGLYGALIIDPANPADEVRADHEYTIQLQEWLVRDGLTYPAMPMDGGQPNFFTMNGRAYPSTDTIKMKVGLVIARDGETLAPSARFEADTVNVGPGQRYDVIWKARSPGKWMIHCHIAHHTTNNNTEQRGGGGLMMHIEVAGN